MGRNLRMGSPLSSLRIVRNYGLIIAGGYAQSATPQTNRQGGSTQRTAARGNDSRSSSEGVDAQVNETFLSWSGVATSWVLGLSGMRPLGAAIIALLLTVNEVLRALECDNVDGHYGQNQQLASSMALRLLDVMAAYASGTVMYVLA